MTENRSLAPLEPRDEEARRLDLAAGTAYGLFIGLLLGLFCWGIDGWLLASRGAAMPWVKVIVGVPLAIIICGLAGRLAAQFSSMAVSIVVWIAALALVGAIAGRLPFQGGTLAVWLTQPSLRGLDVFPYGHSSTVRTTLVILLEAVVGVVAGLLQTFAQGWAWDRATPGGRISVRSFAAILLPCIPLAVFGAWVVEGMVHEPLRIPQKQVGDLVALTLSGDIREMEARGLDLDAVKPFQDKLSEGFVTHLAQYDLQSFYGAYVDVLFDNDFALRCATVGQIVVFCDDFASKLQTWTDQLILAGLDGRLRWEEERWPTLSVDDAVVRWLDAHRAELGGAYEVSRTCQGGGWIFSSAGFDNGFEMTCRFRGQSPIHVDLCLEGGPTSS